MGDHEKEIAVYQAACQHYYTSTNYTWMVGGPLIAGIFVLWGLMFGDSSTGDEKVQMIRWFFCVFISFISAIWVIFAYMQRMNVYKATKMLKRIEKSLELSNQFSFYSNLKSEEAKKDDYKIGLPLLLSGKYLEMLLFVILSLGGPIGYCFIYGWNSCHFEKQPFYTIIFMGCFLIKSIASLVGIVCLYLIWKNGGLSKYIKDKN